ncbi:MAG: HAMP domain-containing protein, partial [Desulfobacterales bacterium]|nr:HAMP domain-containing protein [Desulfobacterales bacterium]
RFSKGNGLEIFNRFKESPTKPTKRLVDAAYKLSNGDLKTRVIEEHRTLELSKLSHAFNEMATSLNIREIEHKALNEELEQRVIDRTSKLEALNNELRDFAHIVSHDLKAPLRAVNQLIRWVLEDSPDSFNIEGKKQMDLIIKRIKHMNMLIDGILEYSQAGYIKEKEEYINLNFLIKEVIDTLSPPNNIHVIINNNLPIIKGDKIQFAQLFQNLISNSIKSINKVIGEIIIECIEEHTQWKFIIIDNGCGIEKKHHEKIFEVFQKLKTNDKEETTGIGLSIVKKIILAYGGKIWVESEIGKGASFIFIIPKERKE